MIDVLAFPPDEAALEALRQARLARGDELERRARLATFVSVALVLTWVADVAAVFEHAAGIRPAAFGAAGFVIAIAIVAAHWLGRLLFARARRLRMSTTRRFAAVLINEVDPLLDLAKRDAVVAQYLRLVGRQQRPLRRIEMAALLQWPQRAPATQPGVASSLDRNGPARPADSNAAVA